MPRTSITVRHVIVAVAVTCIALGAAAADPLRPRIPPEYRSAVRFDLQVGKLVRNFNGTMSYSNEQEMYSLYGAE